MIKTNENAMAFENAINEQVDFFSKSGSLFNTKKKAFYGNEESALELFKKSWKTDAVTSFKLLMWLRDCRGGAGNRSGARSIIKWLAEKYPEWISLNMHLIPLYGRWDDLTVLFTTSLRNEAGIFWANALIADEPDILAAKWAKRIHRPTREALGMKEGEFRKFLAQLRKNHIVEHKMCQNQWNEIEYKTVPSVAMSRYTTAFRKHDEERFQVYKNALKSGTTTVHADVLFPHDCIRTAFNGDMEIAEAQFNSLPNYLEGSDEKIMVLCDTSGSMDSGIGGSVKAIHVSQGLALYCSSRVPKTSPFYKRFIGFGSEGRFVDWRKHSFKTALQDYNVFDGAIASTRIDRALDLILSIATKRKIEQNLMPTCLLIVSDMQFSGGTASYGIGEKEALTEVEKSLRKWDNAGYNRPKIVYWNLCGYKGSPATVNDKNVALISGFAPATLKAVLSGEDFSPYAVMTKAIEKYEITIPRKGENVDIKV
jgi:hypothetical protein